VSYQWYSNNVAVTGATNATLNGVFFDASPANYEVVIANSCGSVTSSPAVVSTASPIGILSHPASQLICQGGSVVFIAFPTNSDSLTYQWRKDGNDIAGANQLFYNRTNVSSGNAGTYACVLSNACGAVLSSNAILDVTICPRFVSADRLSNGALQLRILGYPGSNYITEAATNLTLPIVWIPLDTNSANGSSLIFSTVDNTTNFAQRFFRARSQ
jgi:hypothetical protein